MHTLNGCYVLEVRIGEYLWNIFRHQGDELIIFLIKKEVVFEESECILYLLPLNKQIL